MNDQSYPQVTTQSFERAKSQFGEKFFLFVGVLRYYKGLHILLEAMQGTEFRVVIVGAGPIEK
ncbi:MAG: glycosyltransferase, partial [SAR324 cluster bacterium]|nr:glycosyltransferase [SAR324 cluster bacterium]